jgi:hypothetical protein
MMRVAHTCFGVALMMGKFYEDLGNLDKSKRCFKDRDPVEAICQRMHYEQADFWQ